MAVTIITEKVEFHVSGDNAKTSIPTIVQEHLATKDVEIKEATDGEEDGDDEVPECFSESTPTIAHTIFDVKIGIGSSDDVITTLDTGASFNVLPINVYEKSGLTGMKALKQKVQLADGTMMRPLGYLEDIVVKIDGIEIRENFVVMPSSKFDLKDVVLLGRATLEKLQMVIDMFKRVCSFEFDGERHYMTAFGGNNRDFSSIKHLLCFFGPVYVRTNVQERHKWRKIHKGKACARAPN